MLRTLIVTFFLVTSYSLYMNKGTQPGSPHSPAPVYLSTPKIIPSPEAKVVRTVAKPYTPRNRRFTNREDIAQEIKNKAFAQARPSYLPQVQKRAAKKALNVGNKHRIALHIKSELKRIGCFKGTVSGSWGRKVHTALSHFNVSETQNLQKEQPDLKTLTALRDHTGTACNTKYRVASASQQLTLVQLPVARPQMTAQVATSFISRDKSAVVANNDTVTTEITKPKKVTQQATYKPKRAKKKSRKIAQFTDDNDDLFNNFGTNDGYKKYRRRPAASLVGRRKQSQTHKRRAKKSSRRRQARIRHQKMKRKRYALRKKHRKIRRRYRRARRRFGFYTTGELGYW